MLISPVTQPGAASKRVYLPEGVWYDFWTGERTEGRTTVDRPVDLATLPIYVRAGAVLPLGPLKQYVNEKSHEPLTLRVYSGASGQSFIYADDGESFAYEHGDFMQLSLNWDDRRRQLTLALNSGSKRVWPEFNEIQIELQSGGEPQRINFQGQPLIVQL
jgi:alpha-glucosidase (family GH31 glycosyl hydrolase)